MDNYKIVARHPAYGECTFTIPANDNKQAFSQWKQIVSGTRQWSIKYNIIEGKYSAAVVAESELVISDL